MTTAAIGVAGAGKTNLLASFARAPSVKHVLAEHVQRRLATGTAMFAAEEKSRSATSAMVSDLLSVAVQKIQHGQSKLGR